MNVPWFNWACDFGCGASKGVSSSASQSGLSDGFARLHAAGVHTVRWWVFEGDAWQVNRDASGKPTGLNPAVYADFDAALSLAEKYDLVYDFVLFSSPTAIPSAWVTDPGQRVALSDGIKPLFDHYKGNRHILAWEIFNEPDWDINAQKIPLESVQATVQTLAWTIHEHSGALVTVGSASTDGIWYWRGLGLDFYSPHWYDPMSEGSACARCTNVATMRELYVLDGLPIVLGEFYASPSTDALQRFRDFRAKGFAGAWAWSLFGDRTSDKMQVDLNAMKTFVSTDAGPPATPQPSTLSQKPAVQLLADWVSPVYVTSGQTVTFNEELRSSIDMRVTVDFEVRDSNGAAVLASSLENQTLTAGQRSALTANVPLPSNLAPGQYTVSAKVSSPDRTTQLEPSDTLGTFVIAPPPRLSTPAPSPNQATAEDPTDAPS